MKKTLLSILTLFSATTMFAQSGAANLDFESWGTTLAGPAPTGYVGLGVSQVTTGAQSGSSYAHIETASAQTGILLNGAVVGTSIKQGEAFNAKPTDVTGYIKYDIMAGDTGLVIFQFTKQGTVMGQAFQYVLGANATWTNISLPITYAGTQNPDSIYIILASNGSALGYGSATSGSFLDVDGFALAPWSGISEASGMNSSNVFPNPTSSVINIALFSPANGGKIVIFDLSGKEVLSERTNGLYNSVNVESLSNGIYLYRVIDNANNAVTSGKFSVVK